MKSPILNLTVFTLVVCALCCGGDELRAAELARARVAAVVADAEPQADPPTSDATDAGTGPVTAFVLKVVPATTCEAWTPTACDEAVEGETTTCYYEIVTSPTLEDVVCLGEGCKALIGANAEVLIIELTGEQALFCGEPSP